MSKKGLVFLSIFVFFFGSSFAQVAINTDGSQGDPSAILDIKSTNAGLLLPRMTTTQIVEIINPAAGLMVFNSDSGDFYGFNGMKWIALAGGSDTLTPWSCGDPIIDPRDGKIYQTTLIGSQCWLAENLRAEKLNDGTIIPYVSLNSVWTTTSAPAHCYYDHHVSNGITYGYLYNYYTVATNKICPTGWHVPSSTEWNDLIAEIGGVGSGYQLKLPGSSNWNSVTSSYVGTNPYGFSAKAAGIRYSNGHITDLLFYANFWSSTMNGSTPVYFYLWHSNYNLTQWNSSSTRYGKSVRCIKNN